MALDLDEGYVAPGLAQGRGEASLPIFNVERVQLQFNIASDFVAGQVANNVLILALATGRILRIDLESPSDIDGTFVVHSPLSQLLVFPLTKPTRCRPAQKDQRNRPHPSNVS